MEKQLTPLQKEVYRLILKQKGRIVTYPKSKESRHQTNYVICLELVKLNLIKIDHDQPDCVSFCLPGEASFEEYLQKIRLAGDKN